MQLRSDHRITPPPTYTPPQLEDNDSSTTNRISDRLKNITISVGAVALIILGSLGALYLYLKATGAEINIYITEKKI